MSISIKLLADYPELIPAVGEIRWRDWGHAPEPEELDWWVNVTEKEAGRESLPVTWVALDEQGQAVGAVGLAPLDIEERRDRSPWVIGMIVRPEAREQGIGRALLATLEAFVSSKDYRQIWVGTGDQAVHFYERCGWTLTETIERATGETVLILTKSV